MTDLQKLNVSLTKHGAHKIAFLLKQYPASDVLQHLEGSVPGIAIEEAQAKKNLSVGARNAVPNVWAEVKQLGDDAVDALTLIAIVFSHYKLISTMVGSSSGQFVGKIIRNRELKGKEYTNFAHTLDMLGYVAESNYDFVEYNLEKLFKIDGLGVLARKVFEAKLITAGWAGKNSVIDESIVLQFHKALSITDRQFKNWLTTGNFDFDKDDILLDEDEQFFIVASDTEISRPFVFTPGHNSRPVGAVDVKAPMNKVSARRLHNLIQNKLYEFLKSKHGEKNVGTEVNTGDGTSIDVVLEEDSEYWFYEIKTASSVKASIRQALPQLLEYSYWPNENKAVRLIVVSHLPAGQIPEQYLDMLRNTFGIPIYYEQFCLESEMLISTP
ncbi:hypothetical protein [Pseudomonas sp. 24 E 1]|uniref:hypothetical protein n=1 Tax=Pseudomonas sp. 24 E 1 TaxID=1844094 RepID=UPI000812AC34|nr:hypothetical protein [Pseudomonas sp. 24 E 1]CRM37212.1 hypothetical protein [Pseudomonas sp. 24 E 1]